MLKIILKVIFYPVAFVLTIFYILLPLLSKKAEYLLNKKILYIAEVAALKGDPMPDEQRDFLLKSVADYEATH